MKEKIQKLIELRAAIKELQTQEKLLTEEFKLMGVGAFSDEDYSVIVSEQTRETLDSKRLEAVIGDLSEFKKKTTYRTVKASGQIISNKRAS